MKVQTNSPNPLMTELVPILEMVEWNGDDEGEFFYIQPGSLRDVSNFVPI